MSASVLISLLFVSSALGYITFRKGIEKRADEGNLNQELLQEGLLSMPEGHPTVQCLSRKIGGTPTLVDCQTSDKRYTIGCYAAFDDKGDYLQQGCLANFDDALRKQCTRKRCDVTAITPRVQEMNFCCCFGDGCNAHYTLPVAEEDI